MAWITRAEMRGPVGSVDGADALTLAPGSAATAEVIGPPENRVIVIGVPEGKRGLPGLNAVPTDTAFATLLGDPDTESSAVLDVAIVDRAVPIAAAAAASEALKVAGRPPVPAAQPSVGITFPGTAGNFISTAGEPYAGIQDVDVAVLVTLPDWTPAAQAAFISQGNDTGGSRFKFELSPTGVLVFRYSPTGSSTFIAKGSLSGLDSLPGGTTLWVRAALDADNGNGETELYFYTSSDGKTWSQLGTSVKTTGAITLPASTDPVRLGAYGPGGAVPFVGTMHEAIIRNGIDGPIVGHWKAGNLPYSDEYGNAWAVTGSGTFTKTLAPSATLSMLPGRARNTYGYNARSYSQPLAEWGGYQFAAWWGEDGYARVARRTLGGSTWSVYSMQAAGGLMAGQVAADSHNVLAIAVDKDGYLHLAGNMHGDWLKYSRSTEPGVITGWEAPAMIRGTGSKAGTDEGLVSYPRFLTNPMNGDLFFFYRNGSSGSGNSFLNRYSTATKTWTRVGQVFDGTSTSESAYENTIVFDRAGTLHVSFTWAAQGSGFNDRTDLSYVKSLDGGVTWRDVHNTPVESPITHTNAPIILPAGSGDGLLNQTGMCVDDQGRPHIAFFWAPDGNRNIWHTYWNGTEWRLEKVTTFAQTGIVWTGLSRPAIIHYAGRTWVIWRHQDEGWRGTVWITDVTEFGRPIHGELLKADLREWEPAPDMNAVRGGVLNLLVTRTNAEVPAQIPGFDDANWGRQPVGVLSVKLAGFDSRAVPRLAKDKPSDP